MKNELEKKDDELKSLRQQLVLRDKQLEDLIRENESLRTKINAYRIVAVTTEQNQVQEVASVRNY